MPAWFLLIPLVALVASCAGSDEEQPPPPPLDPPDPNDTTIPPSPRNDFDQYYPPTQNLGLRFAVSGASYPPSLTAEVPASGCSLFRIDRQDICFAGEEPCDSQGEVGQTSDTTADFRMSATWNSAPPECSDPEADSCSGLVAVRTFARAQGDLSDMRRAGMSQSWGEVYPDVATLGLIILIYGTFNRTTGQMDVNFANLMPDAPAGEDDSGKFVLPLYDSAECRAVADFSNEGIVPLGGAADVNLPGAGQQGPVTLGIGAPSGVQVQATLTTGSSN